MYDEIEMSAMYRTGFWVGAASGFFTALAIFAAIGYYMA